MGDMRNLYAEEKKNEFEPLCKIDTKQGGRSEEEPDMAFSPPLRSAARRQEPEES